MKKLFTLLIIAMMIVGCQGINEPNPSKPDQPTIELSIDTSMVVLSSVKGESATLNLKSSVAWSIDTYSVKDWFEISPRSGNAGNAKLTITTTQENETDDDRSATIRVIADKIVKEISITQKKKGAIILSDDTQYIDVKGGEFSIMVKSNIDYTVTIDDSCKNWLTQQTKSDEIANNEERFIVSASDLLSVRSGVITFKSGSITEKVTVYQMQNNTIILSNRTVNLNSNAQTFEVKVKSNIEYFISIDYNVYWVRQVTTKTLKEDVLTFQVDANTNETPRSTEIIIRDYFSQENDTLTINQSRVYKEIDIQSAGTLYDILSPMDLLSISALKLNGVMNSDDFNAIKVLLPNIKTINLENIQIDVLPNKALYNSNISQIILPKSLIRIGDEAFANNKNLSMIEFPKGLISIGVSAFAGCSGLTTIRFETASSLKTIGNSAFSGNSIQTIKIPASVEIIGSNAFYNNRSLNSIIFENEAKLHTIGDLAFSSCEVLKSIKIPKNLQNIGTEAFSSCRSLTTVLYDTLSSLKVIGKSAFYSCALESMTIPASVTTIESSTFSNCTSLTSITIPASVTTIGYRAFSSCLSLTSITIPASVTTIERGTFYVCSSLTSITIPASVTTIGSGAFSSCSSLTSIAIPASVTTIGSGAFSSCSKLASVTFETGSKLKTIDGRNSDWGVFQYCNSLTSITIPASVETIGESAFADCSKLASVTFETGSKLKTISDGYSNYGGTFNNCSSLTTFDAENCELLTDVGYNIFYGCRVIKLIKIGAVTPPTCYNDAFYGVNSDTILKVPSGSIEAYKSAYGWRKFSNITALD